MEQDNRVNEICREFDNRVGEVGLAKARAEIACALSRAEQTDAPSGMTIVYMAFAISGAFVASLFWIAVLVLR